MKKILGGVVCCMLILGACVEFPSHYEHVMKSDVRLLDFIYDPVDASPGDTVLLTAVFAGKRIDENDLQWSVSYDVAGNPYGVDSAFDIQPLQQIAVDHTPFSENTSTIAFKFVVPVDIIRNSTGVASRWASMVTPEILAKLPMETEDTENLTLSDAIDYIELLGATINALPEVGEQITSENPELLSAFPSFLQMFTTQMRIYAQIRDGHRIRSDFSVRYNNALRSLSGIPINRNPVIDSAGIYKVQGENRLRYNLSEGRYQFFRIRREDDPDYDPNDKIPVESGYTYFLAAFSSDFDSTLTLDGIAEGGRWSQERHRTQWYSEKPEDVPSSSYVNVINMGNELNVIELVDREVPESLTIWLEVYDYMPNVIFRPQGSTLAEYTINFDFGDE
ncbi:hypothetical protein QA601_01090 [Chitinispirillales bacterium ANBcel5]|uniref:hypothetical protein n=1 Tax=Cellulosispirillum alkaliphilum TaxID=3039283 RepID=UPI002A56A574|nr:hypothetical protein [Chitinispirillales bacterium ANBcel5]